MIPNHSPIMSTLLRSSSPSSQAILAYLIVIFLTLLPFGQPFNLKDESIVLYSNSQCLIMRYLPSSGHRNRSPKEVKLKINGQSCSEQRWITSIDYYTEDEDDKDNGSDDGYGTINLVWGDSDSRKIYTGQLNVTSGHVIGVKPLPELVNHSIGSSIRSLTIDRTNGVLYASLPTLSTIDAFDLTKSSSNQSTRKVIFSDINVGKLLLHHKLGQLFWIEANQCLWSGSPTSLTKKLLICTRESEKDRMDSFTIDEATNQVYIFYKDGKIERIDVDGNNRELIVGNSLAGSKFTNAKFYTVTLMMAGSSPNKETIQFYASDVEHTSFRMISLIKKETEKENVDSREEEEKFSLEVSSSGILFVDRPSIYDFVILGGSSSASIVTSKTTSDINTKSSTTTTTATSTGSSSQSIAPLVRITQIIKSSLATSPTNRISEVIFKTAANSGSESPGVEFPSSLSSLPPSLPPSSPSLVSSFWWLYVLFAVGLVIGFSWTMITCISLKRNYQKIFVFYDDASSLKENLTHAKY